MCGAPDAAGRMMMCHSDGKSGEFADEIAQAAVTRTFAALGIDINDPAEIRHFQANMAYLWRLRRLSEKVGMAIILTIASIVTGGALMGILEAIRGRP